MSINLRTAFERLLELDPGPQLLDQWARARGAEDGRALFHEQFFPLLRSDPGLALASVDHVLDGLPRSQTAVERGTWARLRAHALKASGRMSDAEAAYAHSWKVLVAGPPIERVRTAIGWSDALALTGRPRRALEVAEEARRLVPRGEAVVRARLEANSGTALYLMGRLEEAAGVYGRARRSLLRSGFSVDAAICQWNVGNVHLLRGETGRARRAYLAAAGAFEKSGLRLPQLHCRYGLAALDLGAGRWSEGLPTLFEVRDELLRLGDQRAAANVDEDTARLLTSLGIHALATESAGRAHDAFRRLGLVHEEARCATLHARLLILQGRTHDAELRLEQAVAYWGGVGHRAAGREAELELAHLHQMGGRFSEALVLLDRLQRWADRTDPRDLGARARALRASIRLRQGQYATASELARRAHRDARRHPARWERPAMALLVARAEGGRGHSAEAVRWARRAVRQYEELARRLGRGRLRAASTTSLESVVREAVDVVLAHGGRRAARTAIDLLTIARSPALIEDLLRGRSEPLEEELRTAITRLRDRLMTDEGDDSSDVRTKALRGEVEELERRLEHVQRRTPPMARRVLRRRQLEAWLPLLRGRQLVMHDRSEDGWRAFSIRASGRIEWAELPSAQTAIRESWLPLRMMFEAAAHAPRAAREKLLQRTQAEADQCLRRLYEAFWLPLGGVDPDVVITPVGPLNGVPLEAALESHESQRVVVTRVPHPALLSGVKDRRARREALLLQGRVPGADDEVRTVGKQLRDAGYRPRVESTRRGFLEKSGPLGVLHVAAHGSYHRSRLLSTGIELDDGWLGFEQLDPAKLRESLLFFDSCESGLAMEAPGSELDGWMSAGLAAGAREIVITLWKIDAASAQSFAQAFYSHWCSGSSAAEAASTARRELRQRRPHAFAWAPFVTVG